MKHPVRFREAILLFGAALSATTPMLGAEVDDGWRNLRQITWDRQYTVVIRDGHCVSGTLVSATEQQVAIRQPRWVDSGKELVIKRADVLRISDIRYRAGYPIFSGRSSWSDVKSAEPVSTEYLHVITKAGAEWKWKQPVILDESVAFEGKTVAKSDIRYVSYVRFKPLTEHQEWLVQESGEFLDPRLWFNGIMRDKLSVLLYNSIVVEDNSPISCE